MCANHEHFSRGMSSERTHQRRHHQVERRFIMNGLVTGIGSLDNYAGEVDIMFHVKTVQRQSVAPLLTLYVAQPRRYRQL